MGFIQITKEQLNKAFTENGDLAYDSTQSYCLDYFASVGGMRFNYEKTTQSFIKAFYEDKLLAVKILFYSRDIKNGLGERNIFRYTFNMLCNFYPSIAEQIIEFIPLYGRFDDLLVGLYTPCEEKIVAFIDKQLKEDLLHLENNESISLLGKWLPSINTSSNQTRQLANHLCSLLKMNQKEYRQVLAKLRKGVIIENNLREKDYSFEYGKVPGGALFKYTKAFFRNDKNKFQAYLLDVKKGKKEINSQTLYPYQVVREINSYRKKEEETDALDVIWKSFSHEEIASKTLVVRDGSGSMELGGNPTPDEVATSLAILFAERLTGEFANTFITFSSKPKIVTIQGDTILEKVRFLKNFYDYTNTDIQKVYDLILKVYQNPNFKKEDALDRIVIISDMEFDGCMNQDESTFDYFKKAFEQLNYQMPELVFWNVACRNSHFPTLRQEKNIKLISGSSQNVIDMIIKDSTNPYDFMLQCLKTYDDLNTIKF